jgi:RNA polymerase sigma factor (sigma-70 family)
LLFGGHYISASIKNIIRQKFPQITHCESEDIEQDVKLKLWEMLESGKKIRNLKSYLWKVVQTTTLDVLGTRIKSMTFEGMTKEGNPRALFESGLAVDSPAVKKEIMLMLEKAVQSLPRKRRLVLKLHLSGMDIEGMADFLGWSQNKVRHLLYRGMADLKKLNPTLSGSEKPK